ncbi:MAG: deoxyribodipyrimidine photo-lyase [Gammaproteobacteria bacterium]|nr:deoxyribodipyrimidine photo-lyase [Gammaproteobacteria bacterium]
MSAPRPKTIILWLRRDLRLADNPALQAAVAEAERLVPLYIHAPAEESPWTPGAASHWWLHWSLTALEQRLRELGSRLWIGQGESLAVLRQVIAATGAQGLHWNRLYDPTTRARDAQIKQALRADGLTVTSHPGTLLFEPWEIATGSGEPYRVFTPFWRRATTRLATLNALPTPTALPPAPTPLDPIGIADLGLLPRIPWDGSLRATWTPGEDAANARTAHFLSESLHRYGHDRDRPDHDGTSRLSAHLHFGEISPRRLLSMVRDTLGDPCAEPAEPFMRELGWREFAHHLIYHFGHTTDAPLDPRFAALPWREQNAEALLAAWQRGATGIPLVDAGMRQLWHTGWMHNRVRMVVASFLTKNLRLPWQAGTRWFWDTLVDADLASNTLGWQWSAGCGADAAPYFRIFNPVLQGERFDPRGVYVRHWCPELARLPDRFIHQPWAAPAAVLRAADVQLGIDYPAPVVDLKESRAAALAAYEVIKTQRV